MTAPDIRNKALAQFFASEYDQDWTCIARYELLDEQTGSRELVTAEVYSNGNEYAVRAWTHLRAETQPERDTARIVPDSPTVAGRDFTFMVRVDLSDLEDGGAIAVSETLHRMIVRQAQQDLASGVIR